MSRVTTNDDILFLYQRELFLIPKIAFVIRISKKSHSHVTIILNKEKCY